MLGWDYNWEKMQSLDAFFLTSPQEIVEISQKFVAVDVEDFLPFVRNRTSNSDVHRLNNSRWNGVLNKIVEPWGFTTCERFERSYVANLLWNIFSNFLPNFRLERGIWEDYQAPNCPKIGVLGACIWLARRFSPSYVCLFFLQQRFVQRYMLRIYLGTSSSLICQVWALDEAFDCLWYEATVYFKTDTP